MHIEDKLIELAAEVLHRAEARGLMLATAESCTGGLASACLTAVPGSSAVVDRAFITYSNAAKQEMLGVPAGMIEVEGAVSAPVAEAMAAGAVARSQAGLAFSATGIAGPEGGTADKPVGLVYIGCAQKEGVIQHRRFVFKGMRHLVREQTVEAMLRWALELLPEAD